MSLTMDIACLRNSVPYSASGLSIVGYAAKMPLAFNGAICIV
jgi:hypothetical protein